MQGNCYGNSLVLLMVAMKNSCSRILGLSVDISLWQWSAAKIGIRGLKASLSVGIMYSHAPVSDNGEGLLALEYMMKKVKLQDKFH